MNSSLSIKGDTLLKIIILIVTFVFAMRTPRNVSYAVTNVIPQKQESILSITIDNYIEDLQKNGYKVTSFHLDFEKMTKNKLDTYHISEEDIRKQILNSLEITISCYELHIKDDVYYFKTETECNDYINSLNTIKKQEYSIVENIQEYSQITSQDVLIQKTQAVQAERDAEVALMSRSAGSRREGVPAAAFPLKSYSYISSHFGEISSRRSGAHDGVDFAASFGTLIYSWKSGKVTFASYKGSYGNYIIVEHNDGTESRYAHCSRFAVSIGQQVEAGELIGYVGSTGNSTGPHLHFQVYINGQCVNPEKYL